MTTKQADEPLKTLHLLVTSLCDRHCKFCCNRKYDIINLPYATDEDFEASDLLCLTGGEPFTYTNPSMLAYKYKELYPNIKAVIVYANASELYEYYIRDGSLDNIDGVNISIKDFRDLSIFNNHLTKWGKLNSLKMNRIYDFTGDCPEVPEFEYIKREWQADFTPAENCIFKRGN